MPLFKRTKQDIHETLTRIDNKLIKIGVFGTFSAGKSSLINALLGEHILVSSPNLLQQLLQKYLMETRVI